MADRHRSKDGSRDTDKVLGEAGATSQQGRSGGVLQRDIATRDEQTRATARRRAHARHQIGRKRRQGCVNQACHKAHG